MNDEGARGERKPWLILRAAQWAACLFAVILELAALTALQHYTVPGVSQAAIIGTLAAATIVVLVTFPYIFWKLPKGRRWIANAALVFSFFYVADTLRMTEAWYALTPEGTKEANLRAKLKAEEAKQLAARKRITDEDLMASAEDLDETIRKLKEGDLAENKEKLDHCLSYWDKDIDALSAMVKGSLHNPKAFEHVQTTIIRTSSEGYNAMIEFRAENEFGAVRTATQKAKIDPNNCEVSAIQEEPEIL